MKLISPAFFLLLLLPLSIARAEIVVKNHLAESTVHYQVVLLRGTVTGDASSVRIHNPNAAEGSQEIAPAIEGERFKALVELSPGKNAISLEADGGESLLLPIDYEPATTPHYLRLIWLTDSSGATEFAAPTDDHPQDYAERLRTAALLMQTFTAERMHDLGFGRKTFRLERDDAGEIVVHTWKGDRTTEEYYALGDSNNYWSAVREFINQEHPDPFAKNCVLAAFTRKNPDSGKMLGHTALGGGNLGLFGSASVFSWPTDVQEAATVFSDDTPIDPTRVHDDSAGRSTVWGLASTTIGATLHEMGHSLGLPHCNDPRGIMTRGFDHFNRLFTFQAPPSGRNKEDHVFGSDDEPYFAPISASFLQHSRWLQAENTLDEAPVITLHEDGSITARSTSGVPWMGLWVESNVFAHREFRGEDGTAPQEIRISAEEVAEMIEGKKLSTITAISSDGMHGRLKVGGVRRLGK